MRGTGAPEPCIRASKTSRVQVIASHAFHRTAPCCVDVIAHATHGTTDLTHFLVSKPQRGAQSRKGLCGRFGPQSSTFCDGKRRCVPFTGIATRAGEAWGGAASWSPRRSPAPSDLPLQGGAAGARATRPRVGGLPPGGSPGVKAPRPLRGDPPGGDSPAGVHAL